MNSPNPYQPPATKPVEVIYNCPACQNTVAVVTAVDANLGCPQCGAETHRPENAWQDNQPVRCLVCGCNDLFVRKDFSQRLGVAIVVVGFVVSSVFWYYRIPIGAYATLFATALLDFALYFFCGNLLECYRCHAQYRGVQGLESYEPFDLETHEKHRQQAARLK